MQVTLLPWQDPLETAAGIGRGEKNWVLLYSGMNIEGFSGGKSFLALSREKTAASADELEKELAGGGKWFGYMGYEGEIFFSRFASVMEFDHLAGEVKVSGDSPCPVPASVPVFSAQAGEAASNMSDDEYLERAANIVERIKAGELYQANLTRKYYGEFSESPDCFALFARLARANPSPYSAFIKNGDDYIISCSPERFIKIEQGKAVTDPIKGTSPRKSDADQDRESLEFLKTSEKNRAENLMITDLMRNDFSRKAVPGSVAVEELFKITSYANVHHMSSRVSGLLREGVGALEFVKSCFPPGSMTGAPKKMAMEVCESHERAARGVYSGALGWITADSCDLSVVIRTLLVSGRKFELQSGGGIVADSGPKEELAELNSKIGWIFRGMRGEV